MSSEQSSRFIAIVDDDKWLHQVGSVLETLNQGVVISDEDRRIVFANSMFLEMSKMSAEEVLGRSVMDLYPSDDVARLQEFIARREAQGRARYEFYIPQADGGRLPVAVTSRLVHGGDGRAYGVVTATDISDQKRAQMELSQTNALLLERHRQMEQELQLAERVQQSLAPKGLTWGGEFPSKRITSRRHPLGETTASSFRATIVWMSLSATFRVTASVRPSSPIASTPKQWRRLSAVRSLGRCCGI